VKIFFLFHLGNGMFLIIVTQSAFPLTAEFNACQNLLCGDLKTLHPNSSSKDTPFICVPSQDPQGSLVSVQSRWIWGGTPGIKDILPPFMTILKAGPVPGALIRLQFPPSRKTDSLLTDYS
jgi:hypothetical protein